MATPQQPLFDSTQFDPGRTELPQVELVKSIGKASDVIVGVATSKGRPTLIGASPEVEVDSCWPPWPSKAHNRRSTRSPA